MRFADLQLGLHTYSVYNFDSDGGSFQSSKVQTEALLTSKPQEESTTRHNV